MTHTEVHQIYCIEAKSGFFTKQFIVTAPGRLAAIGKVKKDWPGFFIKKINQV